MPCGTGKTLVQLWAAERLLPTTVLGCASVAWSSRPSLKRQQELTKAEQVRANRLEEHLRDGRAVAALSRPPSVNDHREGSVALRR
jgi:hypothetical protein